MSLADVQCPLSLKNAFLCLMSIFMLHTLLFCLLHTFLWQRIGHVFWHCWIRMYHSFREKVGQREQLCTVCWCCGRLISLSSVIQPMSVCVLFKSLSLKRPWLLFDLSVCTTVHSLRWRTSTWVSQSLSVQLLVFPAKLILRCECDVEAA